MTTTKATVGTLGAAATVLFLVLSSWQVGTTVEARSEDAQSVPDIPEFTPAENTFSLSRVRLP